VTTLGALLLNPPTTNGAQTRRHLQAVAGLLDCNSIEIANLFAVPTRDLSAVNAAGQSDQGWDLAQPRLREVIATADHLLAAWGVGGLSGRASAYQRRQLRFVASAAQEAGRVHIWTLNGEPRHPSRWHQYVSDRHGRASGSSLTERLAMVLTSVPIETLCTVTGRRYELTWCPPQHSAITPASHPASAC
jgi:hypothetical protein